MSLVNATPYQTWYYKGAISKVSSCPLGPLLFTIYASDISQPTPVAHVTQNAVTHVPIFVTNRNLHFLSTIRNKDTYNVKLLEEQYGGHLLAAV